MQLPENWNKHWTEEGERYFTNTETGASQWTPPEGATGGSAVAVAGAGAVDWNKNPSGSVTPLRRKRTSTMLPEDWEKQCDEMGRRYYWNQQTNETQWEAPEGATGGSTGLESTE